MMLFVPSVGKNGELFGVLFECPTPHIPPREGVLSLGPSSVVQR